jgi:hypothetical protein
MSVGVMKDYKLIRRNLRVVHCARDFITKYNKIVHVYFFCFLLGDFSHFFGFKQSWAKGKGFKNWQLRVRTVYIVVLEVAKGRIIWQLTLE